MPKDWLSAYDELNQRQEVVNDVWQRARREAWMAAHSSDRPLLYTIHMRAAYDACQATHQQQTSPEKGNEER